MELSDRFREIRESESFLSNLLKWGESRIISVRESGVLDVKIKGAFESGVEDEITRADKEVRDKYLESVRINYPNWNIIMEDSENGNNFDNIPNGEIVTFFDPLDGTKLLKEGKKGYSTMASVGIKTEGKVNPVLGLIRIVKDSFISAYNDGTEKKTNINLITERKSRILGRTLIERAEPKILRPLTEQLGYEVKMIRGIGPNVSSLIRGETSVCVYEPGINFWDIFPAMPIISVHGGEVFGLDGKEIVYDGQLKNIPQGVIMLMEPEKKEQILQVSIPLFEKYLSAKNKK
jgi:fructose-1,6-bisphosphatase/inositol monophosphatase family enzyme